MRIDLPGVRSPAVAHGGTDHVPGRRDGLVRQC